MDTKAEYVIDTDTMQVRDARTEKRFFIDNIIIRGYGPKIGVYGIAVYAALCMHAKLTTQRCFPSHKTIAEEIGCSAPKVKEALRQLERLKLIHVQSRYDRENRRQKSNLYTLLDPPVPPDTTDTLPPYTDKSTMNNPNLDQSEIQDPADAIFPVRDDPPPEPPQETAQQRLERMRAKFGDNPVSVGAHCQQAQEREGQWTVPGDGWDVALDAWCTLIGKPKGGMTIPTQIKLKGIFQDVGTVMESTAPEVASAIGRYKERYDWWDDDWPSDGFTNRLGMLLVPNAKETHVVHTGYRDDSPGAI